MTIIRLIAFVVSVFCWVVGGWIILHFVFKYW